MTAPAPIVSTHDALLRAVLLAPHDDQPRLIYADWCEENGQDERAEFVRRNVQLSADIAAHVLDRNVFTSLRNYERNGVSCFVVDGQSYWPHKIDCTTYTKFERGFVREIHVTHDYFIEHAAAIFAAHPVERVVLTDREPWRRFDG